jgi:hypothetical protein
MIMDGSFQRGPQRTVPNDDQLARNATVCGPLDHRPPGAQQREHTLLGNQTGNRDATGDATLGRSFERSEASDVHRRGQPQQSPARAWAESAGNAAFGIAGDRCEVIAAIPNPAQQAARCGHPRPPGFVAMGKTEYPRGTGTPQ